MAETVRDTGAMIAGMAPRLSGGAVRFAALTDPEAIAEALPAAEALIREDEATTLILPVDHAAAGDGPAMRRITLEINSSLEGVGLTAAVSAALAEAGLFANVVAAYHHDHVYVPAERAQEAVALLTARAQAEQRS